MTLQNGIAAFKSKVSQLLTDSRTQSSSINNVNIYRGHFPTGIHKIGKCCRKNTEIGKRDDRILTTPTAGLIHRAALLPHISFFLYFDAPSSPFLAHRLKDRLLSHLFFWSHFFLWFSLNQQFYNYKSVTVHISYVTQLLYTIYCISNMFLHVLSKIY